MISTAMIPSTRPDWMATMEQAAADLAAADPVVMLEHKSAGMRSDLAIEEALAGNGGVSTNSGVDVGPESALRVATVLACRRVIAEDIAKMPRVLKQTKRNSDGTTTTRVLGPNDHPVARVLAVEPCDWLTPFQFWEWLVGCAVLHRAAYALPLRVKGSIEELLPLPPGAVSVIQQHDWDVEYHVHTSHGASIVCRPGEIMQLTGPLDTTLLQGYAVSSLAREAIGLAVALEGAVARFHKNDLRPSGILTSEKPITVDVRRAIKTDWDVAYGPGGDGGVAVLDNAFKFQVMTATSADSQTKENRDHQISEICRAFRVFPQLVMHSGSLQGYGSFEQAMENHTKLTLMPWVDRVEQAAMKALLTADERRDGYHIHIDVDAVARGTLTDRVNAYKSAVTVYLTPNEIRVREGLDPLPDEAMNKVQLPANNTGLLPGAAAAKPADGKKPKDESAADGKDAQ